MYCSQCGTEIILNAKFCQNCGARSEATPDDKINSVHINSIHVHVGFSSIYKKYKNNFIDNIKYLKELICIARYDKKLLIKGLLICGVLSSLYYYYNYIWTPDGLASTIFSKMANGEIYLHEQNPFSRDHYQIYNMNEKLCEDIAVRNNKLYSRLDKCPPTGYSFFMDPSHIVSLKLGKKQYVEEELWALESVSKYDLEHWRITLGNDDTSYALKFIEDVCKSKAPDSCVYNKELERYEWKEKCMGYYYRYHAEKKHLGGGRGEIISALKILKCAGGIWRVAGF